MFPAWKIKVFAQVGGSRAFEGEVNAWLTENSQSIVVDSIKPLLSEDGLTVVVVYRESQV